MSTHACFTLYSPGLRAEIKANLALKMIFHVELATAFGLSSAWMTTTKTSTRQHDSFLRRQYTKRAVILLQRLRGPPSVAALLRQLHCESSSRSAWFMRVLERPADWVSPRASRCFLCSGKGSAISRGAQRWTTREDLVNTHPTSKFAPSLCLFGAFLFCFVSPVRFGLRGAAEQVRTSKFVPWLDR